MMLVTDAPITAWKVIWPFLADSIAMAVVESAIEDVDNAMDDYVTQLQKGGQEKFFLLHRVISKLSHIQLVKAICFPVYFHKFSCYQVDNLIQDEVGCPGERTKLMC